MSNFSDFAENKLADMVRRQAWSLPSSLYAGLASVAADGSVTELTGTGYARVAIPRTLTAWAGTQGAGTTLASTGTSHATSNNAAVNWGTAGAAGGTAAAVVLFDAATGGNAIARRDLPESLVINSGDPVSLAAGALEFVLGLTGGCTDYLANKLIDDVFRGQAWAFPATLYAALLTAAPSNAGGGTEVAALGYARATIAGTLAAWSGTQGAGSTTASTGSGGRISNNTALTFPTPGASWGTAGWLALLDGAGAANMLFWTPLAAPKTINAGRAPSFAADTLSITFA